MKFVYNLEQCPSIYPMAREHMYFTPETIRQIEIKEATEELINNEEFWPIYDVYNQFSTDFAECKDINDAYTFLLDLKNMAIYEVINDI